MINARIEHIDIARGIAILLVVLGHCFQSAEAPLNRFILSFHMPLFFFLSGIFAKPVMPQKLLGGVFLKAKRLLIPQITLSITILLLKGGLWIHEGNNILDFDFLSCFGFWFLPVLFICSVTYMLVSSLINLDKAFIRIIIIIVSLAIASVIVYCHFSSNIMLVDWLIKSSMAMFFYFCGAFYKDKVLDVKQISGTNHGLKIMTMISVLLIISQINDPVMMYQNEYGVFPLFLLSSFIGIWLVTEISKSLANTAFLNEMGRLSIAVYVWNFLIVGISIRIINLFMNKIDLINDAILTAATFLSSVIVLYFISKWTYNYLPFLYGKKY